MISEVTPESGICRKSIVIRLVIYDDLVFVTYLDNKFLIVNFRVIFHSSVHMS